MTLDPPCPTDVGGVITLAPLDRCLGLGEHVRRLRQQAGLSQQALADQLGTTQSAVARLEAGRQDPTIATLCRLADVLGCEFVLHVRPTVAA